MIDQADRDLQAWVQSIMTGVDVVLGPPRLLDGKHGVSLYLLALANPPQAWLNRLSTTRLALRYLVTCWGEDELEAHRLLGVLILSVLEKHEYELDLTELPATIWAALGIVPRPAFILSVPLRFERAEPTPKLVRGPLTVHGVPVVSLHGMVLGPGDIPIASAHVEVPALQLTDYTDARGTFRFSTVPAELPALQLLVKARGRVQNITLERLPANGEPLIVRFDSF